ncbi:MAG: hypothetical protein Q9162_006666 [Coniocarpon cinnabarinum]
MRTHLPSTFFRQRTTALISNPSASSSASSPWLAATASQPTRWLANVRDDTLPLVGSGISPAPSPRTVQDSDSGPIPGSGGQGDNPPPDERTIQLGRTVRTLHDSLPTLLATPLPQEILSPTISLHLFPSTHPHLPTVTGRLSYTAALWTAPVAWGRLPVLGNVRLRILSERMVGNGLWNPSLAFDGASRGFPGASAQGYRNEKLIVRWETCGRTLDDKGPSAVDKMSEFLSRDAGSDNKKEVFSGLFVFEFDSEGRVGRHTIEHAQQGGNWERMTRVVSVTDWLIGLAKGRRVEGELALGCERVPVRDEGTVRGRVRRFRD